MDPYFSDSSVTLYHGDCLDVLRELPDCSVDAVVCDPPYGLANTDPAQVADTITRWVNGERDYLPGGYGFMGKAWDAFVPPVAVWDDCLRVLKPGGHVLAFAGSRTMDLMTLSLRLAGFDIRDSIAWLYGSGFPKSLDVSKAIDAHLGRESAPIAQSVLDAGLVGAWLRDRCAERGVTSRHINEHFNAANVALRWLLSAPTQTKRPQVPKWDQWAELRRWLDLPDDMDSEVWRLNGLKGSPSPLAFEREVVGTKTGAMSNWNMDGGTKFGERDITVPATPAAAQWQGWGTALKPAFEPVVVARKPLMGTVAANVLQHGTGALNIDACRVGSDERVNPPSGAPGANNYRLQGGDGRDVENARRYAEASKALPPTTVTGRWPANVVLDESQAEALDEQSGEDTSRPQGRPSVGTVKPTDSTSFSGINSGVGYVDSGGASRFFYVAKADQSERPRVNGTAHPTVKPLDLMRWLVRLVTPPGGTVLEPFAGSGTTVEACIVEGFRCIAIEREADYLPLIESRIARRRNPVRAIELAGEDMGLFGEVSA